MQLRHGYTNKTTLNNEIVTKQYTGSDAQERQEREVLALQHLQTYLPIPFIVAQEIKPTLIQTRFLPGQHGQDLIESGQGREVLYLCGRMLRQLQSLNLNLLFNPVPDEHSVIVHGDYGPQNILIDPNKWQITGVLDWEWVHPGDPIEDLAWAEWIVRTHHSGESGILAALFEGYGSKPQMQTRLQAMLRACQQHLNHAQAQGNITLIKLWQQRLAQTSSFNE